MSNSYITLSELVTLNDKNARDLGVTDILNKAPALAAFYATTSSDSTTHKYIKSTVAPGAAFRTVNTGKYNTSTTYTEVTDTLALMDCSFSVDQAIADSYIKGTDAFLAKEGLQQIRQGFFYYEQQVWYGTSAGDASGFTGFNDSSLLNAAAGAMVINAGGTTASTGSSVFFIRSTPDETGMAAVLGQSGQISIRPPVSTSRPDDTTPAKSYPAYMVPILGYTGLQFGSNYSVARIANLTADSGKGLTDSLMSQCLQLFPAYAQPNLIVMNRRSLGQLQRSRTVYSPIGAPAPFPKDYQDIPIIVTDSISNTEALLT